MEITTDMNPMIPSALVSDWKYPRTAKGFTGAGKSISHTILRCVTNSVIPCTAQEFFASMGKTRFTLTVIGMPLPVQRAGIHTCPCELEWVECAPIFGCFTAL